MASRKVDAIEIGDDHVLREDEDGNLVVYNARRDEPVDLWDRITGNESKEGHSVDNVLSASENWINVKAKGAKGDGTTDDSAAIQSAIDDAQNGQMVYFPPGDYLIQSTLDIYKPLVFGGLVDHATRWNQEVSSVTIIWDGGATDPAIEVGGTSNTPTTAGGHYLAEGITLKNFFLKPSSEGGGDVGILYDGSSTRITDRGATRNVEAKNVAVRNFGTNNWKLMGNVFDVDFIGIASKNASGMGFNGNAGATSYGMNNPGQQTFYWPNLYSVSGQWAAEVRQASLFGGIVGGAGSGIKLYYESKTLGTHIEGSDETTGIGVQINDTACRILAQSIGRWSTLIEINATFYSINTTLASADIGIKVTSGGGRKGWVNVADDGNITTLIDNQRLSVDGVAELELKALRQIQGKDKYRVSNDKGLEFGDGGAGNPWYQLTYDSTAQELQFHGMVSGGGQSTRFTIPRPADKGYDITRMEFKSPLMPTLPTKEIDPAAGTGDGQLPEGQTTIYVSDGSAGVTGADGDVIVAVNSGGTIKTKILADFSAL